MTRQNSRTDLAAWLRLMGSLGLAANEDMYRHIIAAYSEKHRAYHTVEHLEACFRHFAVVAKDFDCPQEVEIALWFHDVVYNPFSATNEEDSAELVELFLSQNGVALDEIRRVYDLIILTAGHAEPTSLDGKLMMDIDLSILGAEAHIFAQYEADVRREYRKVPFFIFKRKRREILTSFLARDRIYHTPYFFQKLEAQARTNLAWAIDRL